jgi:hypothetical protein
MKKEIEAIIFLIKQGHQVCWDATIWVYELEEIAEYKECGRYVVTTEGLKSTKEDEYFFHTPKEAAQKYLDLVELYG